MTLAEYLAENNIASRPIQVMKRNGDILHWGNRNKIPLNCDEYWVAESFDIIGAADCVMVEDFRD